MVFCIDTRSELIRRHVENKGHYETLDMQVFFCDGLWRFKRWINTNRVLHFKLCLPCFRSWERHTEKAQTYKQKNDVLNFKEYFLKEWKHAPCLWICRRRGIFYGMSLLARTLIPGYLYRFSNKNAAVYESVLNHRLGTGVLVNRQM
jgi:uncharacterized protein YbcC (UPF0753/DUF2309 family)